MMSQVASINPFLPLTDAENFLVSILIGVRDVKVPITALIMAGGFGKRLGEKTRSTPKPLIEVNGKPLLEHVLLNLEQSAVDKVYVSTHFLADQIQSYIKATGARSMLRSCMKKRHSARLVQLDCYRAMCLVG